MKQIKNGILRDIKRILLVVSGAVLMSVNINTFVHTAGLLPGGFTGVTLLLQEIIDTYAGIKVPFSVFYLIFNLVPAAVCYKVVGRKFTVYSCVMVVLSGILTDVIPGLDVTDDVLLCSVFGGIVNGCAVSLCLFADDTRGGTKFIAH